jgi:hypothetical protein
MEETESQEQTQNVHVIGIMMPFDEMVTLLVKLAAIPAVIILCVLAGVAFALISSCIHR